MVSLTLYSRILLIIGLLLPPTYTYCYAHNSGTDYQQETNHNHNEPCHIHAKHCAGRFTCKNEFNKINYYYEYTHRQTERNKQIKLINCLK